MEEIWKAISNYSSYEVSNLGRVKSLARECQHLDGTICHLKERILQQSITIKYRNGKIDYTKVKLVDDQGISHNLYVHRLVAEAFIPNPENLPEVNHIDLNKSNNNIYNLEWVSKQQNVERCIQKPHKGSTNGNSKLSEDIVIRLRNYYQNNNVSYAETARQILNKYHISITPEQVSNIIKKQQWQHI